jgi:hypothetical protein
MVEFGRVAVSRRGFSPAEMERRLGDWGLSVTT